MQTAMPGVTLSYGYAPVTGALSTVTRVDGQGTHLLTLPRDGRLLSGEQWSGSAGMTTGSVVHVRDANFWTSEHRVNGAATGMGRVVYTRDKDGLITGAGPVSVSRDPASGLPITVTLLQTSTTLGWSEHGELDERVVSHAGSSIFVDSIALRDARGRALTIDEKCASPPVPCRSRAASSLTISRVVSSV